MAIEMEVEEGLKALEEVEKRYPTMSESEKLILMLLASKNPKKISELSKETSLSLRSIRYSLKKLLGKELIVSYPDFNDLRSYFYQRKA
ncbi:MAG: MarR family transcriptional regulator [Candidatus Hodarchaeales archaeon]|jgi:DNA-binding MarR family transcriptional regulator